MNNITIDEQAQAYFIKLAAKEENKLRSLRLCALDPLTPYAEANLDFVEIGPDHVDDLTVTFPGFTLFVERKSEPYLKDASITFNTSALGGDLLIDTPNLQPIPMLTEEAPLEERLAYFFNMEVNPELSAHGGHVRLVEVSEEGVCKVVFGGGCQGCSQIGMTLKHGVEKEVVAKFPEITAVEDVTNHAMGANPYF
jgi:Fe/S biogenesis protein NfuA